MTFPDLPEELDRLFPGWRTWDLPDPPPRKKKEEPTMDDRLREYIREQEEEKENV